MIHSIKLAVVDDNELVLSGLRALFASCADIVIDFATTSGLELQQYIKRTQPHVLLLDLQMPDFGGVALCKWVLAQSPATKVLAFSSFDDTYHVNQILGQGASGYLLKNADQQVLCNAIRAVAAGHEYIDESLRKKLLPDAEGTERRPVEQVPLTRREKEILKQLAAGLSLRQIAEKLQMNERSIETQLTHLSQKLGASGTPAMLAAAEKRGLLS